MSLMLKAMRVANQIPVGFNGYSLRDGALEVNCKDEPTKEWFVSSVAGLSPWRGMPLKTCDPSELEGFKKIGTYIPNPVEGAKECLLNLQQQNPGLQTNRWKVLGSKIHKNGMYLVASIPESTAKVIEERNGRIYHGFNNIQIKFFAGKEKSKQEAAEEMEASGSGGVKEAGSAGPVVPAPAVPDPGFKSGQCATVAVKPEPRRQRTEHKGRRDRGVGRPAAGAAEPAGHRLDSGGGKEATPPPPGGEPPPEV